MRGRLRAAIAAAIAGAALGPVAAQAPLELRDNPLAERAAAPERLAYDPPSDTIVQLNPDVLAAWMPGSTTLDKARLLTPWGLFEKWTPVNDVVFEDAQGRRVGQARDLRGIPLNAHGLPDFGHPALGPVTAGERRLGAMAFAGGRNDPDWQRWIAGRYEVITEHEAGASLPFTVNAAGGTVSKPERERLPDGFVRTRFVIDAPDGFAHLSVDVAKGADARAWRRLSIYHTHAYPEADGPLAPTGARALHEAGRVWSPRYLGLFADRYDALRFLQLFRSNNSSELYGDRSDLAKQGTWLVTANSLPYDQYPWDAARHLLGDHKIGAPLEAILRMAYEASLVGRERGREGHVVNPQLLMPFRFEGADVDGFLDEVAAHVAWAAENGVAYDYVKLGVYNEPWNSAPGSFREAHQHAAGLPVSLREYTNEEAWGYDRKDAPGMAGDVPWYTTQDKLDQYGVDWKAAQQGAARRLIHVLSRAHARHPQVNWIGEYAAQTGGGAMVVPWVFEGARDGAADAAAWAEQGDPWTGSKAYAVVPRDEAGRYAVGTLFTYSLTSYFNTYGGPDQRLLAGLADEEVAQRAADGTLADTILRRWLTLPAQPVDPEADKYAFSDGLAGLRARYREIIAAVEAEGGAMIDLYEGGDHTTGKPSWSVETKLAAQRWRASPQHAALKNRLNEEVLRLGLIGLSDWGLTTWDERGGEPFFSGPWLEMGDPYDRDAPHLSVAPRWLGPLPPVAAE